LLSRLAALRTTGGVCSTDSTSELTQTHNNLRHNTAYMVKQTTFISFEASIAGIMNNIMNTVTSNINNEPK